jgi:hypothetical protein
MASLMAVMVMAVMRGMATATVCNVMDYGAVVRA